MKPLDDSSARLLQIITLVYIEELVENAKILTSHEASNKIKSEHIKEIIRM